MRVLLLELGVSRLVLDCTNLVRMVMLLFFSRLVLLPSNKHHSLNIGKSGKRVFLLFLFLALYREGCLLRQSTHIEYLCEDIHV